MHEHTPSFSLCQLNKKKHLSFLLLLTLAWSSLAFCGEIHEAAKAGDLEKVRALLKIDPDSVSDRDSDNLTPLHWAASEGHKDVAELLLAKGASVKDMDRLNGRTPLYMAAAMGHTDVVKLLLQNKADVNAKCDSPGPDSGGLTPLHVAASEGHKDVAELLLANGAAVNAKDDFGKTPLSFAASNDHKDVAELLLLKGADVNGA